MKPSDEHAQAAGVGSIFPPLIHKKSCKRLNKNKEPTTDFLLCAVAFKNMSAELLTAIRIAFHITSLKQTKALSTISGRELTKQKGSF